MARRSTLLGLAAASAMSLMAIGASAASAQQLFEADNMTVAPDGTTFTASGPVTLTAGITNECTLSVSGTVTDNGSTGNPIAANITPSFSGCSPYGTTGNGTWGIELPQGTLSGFATGVSATIGTPAPTPPGGPCTFTETGQTVTGVWNDGSPSSVTLGGTLPFASGNLLCAIAGGGSGTVSGTVTITSTSTPGDNFHIH